MTYNVNMYRNRKKQQGTEDVAGKLVELLKIEVITKP